MRINYRQYASIAALCYAAASVQGYALSGGGVWDIPNAKRVTFDPTKGQIGNMGKAGVVYNVAAAPGGAQAGAVAQVGNAFTAWNVLAGGGVQINFVAGAAAGANVPVSWAALAAGDLPGVTRNAAVNFNPRPIQLDNTRVLRTDGWNLDFTKVYTSTDPTTAGNAPPAIISEYDVYTTSVHEVGHALGLGHPGGSTVVMDPQDSARQTKGGLWQSVAQLTPFATQPKNLAGAALPAGTLAYSSPRAALAADDILGAKTLYTAPKAKVAGAVGAAAGGGLSYSYQLLNLTSTGTDYNIRQVILPVASGVIVTDLTASPGWTLTRDPSDVTLTYIGGVGGEIAGDSSVLFSFDSPNAPTSAEPDLHWDLPSLQNAVGGTTDLTGDEAGANPTFNAQDFTVLDGTFDYNFNSDADQWSIVPLDSTLVPTVPEPAFAALASVLAATILSNRKRPRLR